jgi:hypothetical protein
MPLLHLPDELLRHVLLHCTLCTLRRLKQACSQLRGEGRSMLCSSAWQATPHGAELGQPTWEGQEAGMPINAGHVDCLGECKGQGINTIAGCGERLLVLTTGASPNPKVISFERIYCRESFAGSNACNLAPLHLRPTIRTGSQPRAFAADATHVYVLHNGTEYNGYGTEISTFAYAGLSSTNEYTTSAPGPSSSLADNHAVSGFNAPFLPRFTIDGDFTRLRASCADERLYIACCHSRCVVVLSTADLSQLMVFDASRASPPKPHVEEEAAVGAATVGVGADELEVIGEDRGWHAPMGIAVGEEFVFVAQRACLQGKPDCVAAYRKGTGELSHAIELHDLGVEAVAVHHGRLYVLSTGLDERITGLPAPPANVVHDGFLRQPLLSWMGLRGEQQGPEQRISLLPDGYGGEAVSAAHGSLYVDGPRGTLIVTFDADHELGGHSLCIPLSLGCHYTLERREVGL